MNRAKTLLALAIAAVVALAGTSTAAAAPCGSCVTAIDGHVFTGVTYYDPSPAVDSAVEEWWVLLARPDYRSLPPVLSVSTFLEVTGVVEGEPEASAARSSWG